MSFTAHPTWTPAALNKIGIASLEEITETVSRRAMARLVARQERDLPITHNVAGRIVDAEFSRFFQEKLRAYVARN